MEPKGAPLIQSDYNAWIFGFWSTSEYLNMVIKIVSKVVHVAFDVEAQKQGISQGKDNQEWCNVNE